MRSGTQSMPAPTGRALGQRRLVLGLSARSVARELGIHTVTLAARERDDVDVLDPELLERWQTALLRCANARAVALARQGWRPADLPAGLRSALYVK